MRIIYFFLFIALLCGCSDLYKKDFVRIASANVDSKQDKALLERHIQAMRKSQIMQNNRTQLLAIVHYINQSDSHLAQSIQEGSEVFLVEIFDRAHQIKKSQIHFTLTASYKSIDEKSVMQAKREDLGILTPDISYNSAYWVIFEGIGERGKEEMKLIMNVQNMGEMEFDFGYHTNKNSLAQ
ncbi:hypothetical protein LS68_007675 [Helicobacter sp. MIT 05-5293]|uniref:hypothetical protein n=1 Tax=Helicobacter sp. MIT 05-5293 TaxID=1548149 RepID=UPI00051DED9B|nr:hypothetical protein [Helicobacter sp. MIT 05-5293]TLD80094.1 hypothetical protein LS68_007675 [Helicobacter sp. MIT 05-5293]